MNIKRMEKKLEQDNEPKRLGNCFPCGGKHMRQDCKFCSAECCNCHKIGHISTTCKIKKSNLTLGLQNSKAATASNEKIEENSKLWCLYILGRDYINHSLQIDNRKGESQASFY